jgi:hypothetical protein
MALIGKDSGGKLDKILGAGSKGGGSGKGGSGDGKGGGSGKSGK